jgi:hypothetical protein
VQVQVRADSDRQRREMYITSEVKVMKGYGKVGEVSYLRRNQRRINASWRSDAQFQAIFYRNGTVLRKFRWGTWRLCDGDVLMNSPSKVLTSVACRKVFENLEG